MSDAAYREVTQVSSLPPVSGVQDPAVRSFLSSLVNVLDQRSGSIDKNDGERFVTLKEFDSMATDAMASALSASSETSVGTNIKKGANAALISGLSSLIRQSLVYQALEVNIQAIDVAALRQRINDLMSNTQAGFSSLQKASDGLTTSLSSAVSRVGAVEAGLRAEETTRATADAASTVVMNAAVSRIANSESAITSEQNTRSTKDNAIASAINNIWASIGGNTAVIQDGALAAISPSAAQATRWTQTQAALTDPNTGLINATSLKQDFNSYANAANGKFSSLYTVRAQVAVGGKTVVGGFGLSASTSTGGLNGPAGEGAVIDFGVRADKFFIAATSDTPDAATQIAQGSSIPFMVLTSPQLVNGVMYQPGVYIKKANIGYASIDEAHIIDATITTAKIKDLAVDTLKLAGSSVTISVGNSSQTGGLQSGGQSSVNVGLTAIYPGRILVIGTVNVPNVGHTQRLYVDKNGNGGAQVAFESLAAGTTSCFVYAADVNPGYVGASISNDDYLTRNIGVTILLTYR